MVAKDALSTGLGCDFDSGIDGAGVGGGRRGGRGSVKAEGGDTLIKTVVIKEEEQELELDEQSTVAFPAVVGGGGGNVASGLSCTPISGSGLSELPRPIDGLNDNGPPPFLTKTYEMVEDPETDPIVSWSGGSNSFIVWDYHKFALNLLPKYFKHSNFSSFIRQLNTYGFRKVHLDRWEFANAGFQRGKKHLLKSIKRRNHGCSNSNSNKRSVERETEIEMLKKEQDLLRLEILGLKQQQESTDKHVTVIEERVRRSEWKQRQMLMLIAKSIGKASFLQQLISKCKQRRALGNGGLLKKRRLMMSESNESSSSLNGINPVLKTNKQEVAEMQCEMNSLLDSTLDVESSPTQEQQNSNLTSETSSPDLMSSNYILWEKLMEDDVICESESDALGGTQSIFDHELEDMLEKPFNWGGGYAKEMVAEVGCPGSLA